MSVRKKNEALFFAAYEILQKHEKTLYTQATICDKLEAVGKGVSHSLFNKLVKRNRIGDQSLKKIAEGVQEILKIELGMEYDPAQSSFIKTREPDGPLILQKKEDNDINENIPLFYSEGRRSIEEKAAFISTAQKEVIFLGARLNQFATYFFNRNDAEFKDYVVELLQRGVHFKCYMVAPEGNHAKFYFEDRSTVLPREKYAESRIPEVIKDLKEVKKELAELVPQGKFSIYTYAHLPTAHYLSVDHETQRGKMQVSNYLFGVPRSKVPVVEVHNQQDEKLFELYRKSLTALIDGAREVK